ncbi:MAG: pentapeptide repeat-containing protein [Candidatus Nitrohelix vancouverensis]|uniref:Pentapeptide repeat-containing protein n=1 Tax=Candidatus Nitrohelix vancouverensis TaxID=2705534 RepID=A0A7T0C2I8_9BACT|nr:MAG: pentapeptide repeat-containing protein [Candidatus Nitrohelix vancouverensis]
MDKASLAEALKAHRVWFDSLGHEGTQAVFNGKDLSGADFSEALLVEAQFQGALLCGANFAGADLRGANFQDANLEGALFFDSNLEEADLMWSVAKKARWKGAKFNGTYLQGADLREAADLQYEQLAKAMLDEDTHLPADILIDDLKREDPPDPITS